MVFGRIQLLRHKSLNLKWGAECRIFQSKTSNIFYKWYEYQRRYYVVKYCLLVIFAFVNRWLIEFLN